MKPTIGINVDLTAGSPDQINLNATYYTAIQKAGGIPLPLVPMPDEDLKQVLSTLGGIMLIGGRDYHPEAYGDIVRNKLAITHPVRQDFDLRLAKMVLSDTHMPVLGICAGHQLINISLGGTLVQDIESEIAETALVHGASLEGQCAMMKHPVKIAPGSELHSIYRTNEIDAPSSHHQAIDKLGRGLVVSALAADGIIEAVEAPHRPFTIGVQFHPERDEDPALFNALIRAAQKYLANKGHAFALPVITQAGLQGLYG